MLGPHFITFYVAILGITLFGISMTGMMLACRQPRRAVGASSSTQVPALRMDWRQDVFVRADTSELPVLRARVATTLWQRTRGLLCRPQPDPGHALMLLRCPSIHTVGMAYPIDVVFFDNRMRVTRVATVPPLRLAVFGRGGRHALEMAAGEARRLRIAVGQRIHIWPAYEIAA